jgi:multimeric flavodoxin WrbA
VVEILGISGSPVKNSNTDRLVKLVQDSTGLKSEFIKLFDCKIEPCHVCMWMTLNGEGFFHARTSRRGINTIFDHFRDKPALLLLPSCLEKRGLINIMDIAVRVTL